MRDVLLYIVAPSVCLWFAQKAWTAALALARRDAKEAAALALAANSGPFSRAYSAFQSYRRFLMPADLPWRRPEGM